ncbi:hypothetical protein BDZ91DRAFT_732672, partial [Kalaharituber pfeilii]
MLLRSFRLASGLVHETSFVLYYGIYIYGVPVSTDIVFSVIFWSRFAARVSNLVFPFFLSASSSVNHFEPVSSLFFFYYAPVFFTFCSYLL